MRASAVVVGGVVSTAVGFWQFSHALPSAFALSQQLWLSAGAAVGACSVAVVEAHPMV